MQIMERKATPKIIGTMINLHDDKQNRVVYSSTTRQCGRQSVEFNCYSPILIDYFKLYKRISTAVHCLFSVSPIVGKSLKFQSILSITLSAV